MNYKKYKIVESNGFEHGIVNVRANSCKDNDFKYVDEKNKSFFQKQKKSDCEMVKARFINHKDKQDVFTMTYNQWAGEPLLDCIFLDDTVYTVPKGLIEDINSDRRRPIKRSDCLDANGKPTIKDQKGDRQIEFVAPSF